MVGLVVVVLERGAVLCGCGRRGQRGAGFVTVSDEELISLGPGRAIPALPALSGWESYFDQAKLVALPRLS